jgi:hypothetical protein
MSPRAALTSTAAVTAYVLLGAQAPAAQDPATQYEGMCLRLLKDRTDLVPQCVAEQELAHHFTLSWLGQNGLLAEDGSIDSLRVLEAQSDPFGLAESPAGAAAFCLENGDNWIGISECITALDSNAAFGFGTSAGGLGEPFMDGAHAPFGN